MAATASGFLVKDVLEALDKHMEGHGYDHVCLMVADLACSRQVRRLVSLMVAAVSDRYLGRNLALLENVCDRLEAVQRWRYDGNSRAVRSAMMEVALILTREKGTRLSFDKFVFAAAIGDGEENNGIEEGGGEDGEGHRGPPPGSMVVSPPSDYEVKCIVDATYDAMSNALRLQMSGGGGGGGSDPFPRVAKWLHRGITMDNLPHGPHKNVMETLWELVMVFVKSAQTPSSTMHRYVDTCRRLYWIGLTKARRKERVNLLWGCVYLACKNKRVFSESEAPLPPLPRYDLDAVFKEIQQGDREQQHDYYDDADDDKNVVPFQHQPHQPHQPHHQQAPHHAPPAPQTHQTLHHPHHMHQHPHPHPHHQQQHHQPPQVHQNPFEECSKKKGDDDGEETPAPSAPAKATRGGRGGGRGASKRMITETDQQKLQYLMYYTIGDTHADNAAHHHAPRGRDHPTFKTLTIQSAHQQANALAGAGRPQSQSQSQSKANARTRTGCGQ